MSFLDDFEALRHSIPVPALRSTHNEDCQYMNYGGDNKRCIHCLVAIALEEGIYCYYSGLSKMLTDCHMCVSSELLYECVNCFHCYQSTYLYDCTNCRDSSYCSLCIDCEDCFGCVALTRKHHCIFNKQYTPEEYESEVERLKKLSVDELLNRLWALVKKTPYPQNLQRSNTNCQYGDYLSFSKNVYWGFNTYYLEDSGYYYFGGMAKQCWDTFVLGGGGGKNITKGVCELCYECVGSGNLYNCAFLFQSTDCTSCFYGWDLRNCSDCFGCVALTNKRYCILNNQLTKGQYEEGVKVLRQELGWAF